MIKQADIERFYEHVESLKLKFPVAEIARKTGFSKGNVSDYLRKNREPSQRFLESYYSVFGGSNKVPHETNSTDQIMSSLNQLLSEVAAVRAEIRANTEYQVMKDSRDNENTRLALMMTINKLIGENLKVDEQTGNLSFAGK